METNILDLDALRPQSTKVKLGGRVVEVSFIPVGITFEIDRIINEMLHLDMEEAKKGEEEGKKAIECMIELCATFCSVSYPDMDKEWFHKNVDSTQLTGFSDLIKTTLEKSYAAVKDYGKKQ
jgi:hypothetical protein